MDTKVYSILEKGWEYNDEYFYTPESNGGRPIFVTLNKNVAKKKLEELLIKTLRGLPIGEYSDYGDLSWYYGISHDTINDIFGTSYKDWDITIPDNATDKQMKTLIDTGHWERWYEIVENNLE